MLRTSFFLFSLAYSRKAFISRSVPKSRGQQHYLELLQSATVPMVVAVGPAGSGKTLFACVEAISELKRGAVDKIVLTRPVVSVDSEDLGFLPGNVACKMDPWTRPMFDIFREYYTLPEIQHMIKDGVFEIAPLAFMRGRTFHRSFVIADEMQNSSPNQMLMLTTRIGGESKLVVTGDPQQKDRSFENGLDDLLTKVSTEPGSLIGIARLTEADVFRSSLVSYVLRLYNVKN